MDSEIGIRLSGFLFLFIILLNAIMVALGRKIGIGNYNSDAKLKQINDAPNKFKLSFALGLIEHICVIILAIILSIAFSSYSFVLGILGATFRIVEGLTYSYSEINYWTLLKTANQYSSARDNEKDLLCDKGRIILETHQSKFSFGMIFWSLGTLTFSILFVLYHVLPPTIGWLGIVTSVSFAIGYGIKFIKPGFNFMIAIGGITAILFETIIGIWLLFFCSFNG